MQSTGVHLIEIFAGDTRAIVVPVVDDAGNVLDLTGGSAIWQLAALDWKTDPSAVPLVTKTSAAGQITLGNGSFTISLLSADTVGLTEGMYYQEAQVTLADGVTVGTPLSGKIKLKSNLIAPR